MRKVRSAMGGGMSAQSLVEHSCDKFAGPSGSAPRRATGRLRRAPKGVVDPCQIRTAVIGQGVETRIMSSGLLVGTIT